MTWVAAAAAVSLGAAAQAAEAPARKCVMYQSGDLPVQVVGRRALLPATVNGRPVRVLIDTGASRSILHTAAAAALRLPLTDVQGLRMGGAGGMSQVRVAHLADFQLAGARSSNLAMLVAGEGGGSDFDVLLGEDFLGRFDVEFDLPHGAVRLLEPRGCADQDMAYWTAAYNETPIVDDRRELVHLVVQLNGRPVRAILDSGAGASVGTPQAAAAARVNLEAVSGQGRGIGAAVLTNQVGVLDTFKIGEETIRNARLIFSNLFGATTYSQTGSLVGRHMGDEPEMLLGFDFLRSHRVLISHSRHKLYFTYEGGPVFDVSRRPNPVAAVAPTAPAAPPAADGPKPEPGPAAAPQAAASRSPAGS